MPPHSPRPNGRASSSARPARTGRPARPRPQASGTRGASSRGRPPRAAGSGGTGGSGRGRTPRAAGTEAGRRSGKPPSGSGQRSGGSRSASSSSRPQRPGERRARPQGAGERRGRSASPRRSSRDDERSTRPSRTTGRPAAQRSTGRAPRSSPERRERDDERPLPTRARSWGNVARRGAREVTKEPGQQREDTHERDRRARATAPPTRQAAWVREDGARTEWADVTTAATPTTRTARGARRSETTITPTTAPRPSLPPEVATEIRNAADAATALHKEHLVEKAEAAFGAYERSRFQDALRAIKPVADEAPRVAAVRELAGLAAYRVGRWREAARHLQAFDDLSDATEHLPVLMDIQRALQRPKKVAELWAELRHRSPDADVLAEGRIVAAASLAETGDLNGAISLLASAGASKAVRNPSTRHVRQWYVLADLYERAGDLPRAREYFERVHRVDPQAYDVRERLRALGAGRGRSGGSRRSRPAAGGSRTRARPTR